MAEWIHTVMKMLANSFWLGIISSKHIYHSGSANWMSLRLSLPRCNLGVAVACCYGQQLSCGRRLIIWYSLNLIKSEGGTWECKLRARTEEHSRVTQEKVRVGRWEERKAAHTHQVADSFLISMNLSLLMMITFIILLPTCFATSPGLIHPRSMSTAPVLHAAVSQNGLLLFSHTYISTISLSNVKKIAWKRGENHSEYIRNCGNYYKGMVCLAKHILANLETSEIWRKSKPKGGFWWLSKNKNNNIYINKTTLASASL